VFWVFQEQNGFGSFNNGGVWPAHPGPTSIQTTIQSRGLCGIQVKHKLEVSVSRPGRFNPEEKVPGTD
jgi:hypothetical protein